MLEKFQAWFEKNFEKIREDYFAFLRYPSISADPSYWKEARSCAQFLLDWMKRYDISAELIETSSLPIVYSQVFSEDALKKTVLIYGHYDVQPIDPIEEWISLPFEPTERDGFVFARGAVDDKGQIFYALVALAACKELKIDPSFNVKLCIEGEEESSSKGLLEAISLHTNKLKADHLLVVDFDQFDETTPAVSLGARGMVSFEVKVKGSSIDMHSGLCGGIAYNPNRALVEMLSSLWNEEGVVQVPHFYDDILPLTEEEKTLLSYRYNEAYYESHLGIKAFGGEKEKSLLERNWLRPTIEINGIGGGYVGAGMKTVIPAVAEARISCRLVPGQDPKKIADHVISFLRKKLAVGMEMDIVCHKGMKAFRGSLNSLLVKKVFDAATVVTKKECRYLLTGGSIPVVPALVEALGADVVGMGYGLLEDQIHAPNERFDMKRFEKGFLTVALALCSDGQKA